MGDVLLALIVFLFAVPASAQVALPPGFIAKVYVTGQGFDPSAQRNAPGIPAMATMALDPSGALYLAKSPFGARQDPGEALGPVYRVPVGGARITRESEAQYFYGPPLWNPDVAGVNAKGELFVSSFDRDRRIGALYQIVDGRASLFAGGTPPPGSPPLLRDAEGAAFDGSGNVYVADREQGIVVKLDPTGKVLDPRFLTTLGRARALAFDLQGQLWIASDGPPDSPFQDGSGAIWRANPERVLSRILQGPLPAGVSLSPGGALFVAQRRVGKVVVLTPEGKQVEFASFTDAGFLRALAFAPLTEATRRAGIAGDLFVVVSSRGNFSVSEVIRISGPFESFVRREGLGILVP
jgi:DNA-binding beta-propeller fold protein YncE